MAMHAHRQRSRTNMHAQTRCADSDVTILYYRQSADCNLCAVVRFHLSVAFAPHNFTALLLTSPLPRGRGALSMPADTLTCNHLKPVESIRVILDLNFELYV